MHWNVPYTDKGAEGWPRLLLGSFTFEGEIHFFEFHVRGKNLGQANPLGALTIGDVEFPLIGEIHRYRACDFKFEFMGFEAVTVLELEDNFLDRTAE
jgi:hypothetical protein